MGLEFNWLLEPSTEDLLIVEDDEVSLIMPSIKQLKSKTGVFIDPYSDTRLSPEHSVILVTILEKNNAEKIVEPLLEMLKEAGEKSRWLAVTGD